MYKETKLSLAIRVALAKCNNSRSWLAREAGISRPYVSRLCSDTDPATPSLSLVDSICKAVDMPMSEFIKGGEE